ncbi:transcriptional activator NhaR [Vibrio sp. RC27]
MAHLNYNHLYYFWMVCKQGSVTKAADALFLTPQTVTGQVKAFEERMGGKLTKRNGRKIEPSELGQLVYKYADRMFGLSYEMLDIVNYSQRSNILFDVGVADALSKRLVSKILLHAIPEDEKIHLRCFESTHELLLEQLSQHQLDIIISDCPVDSAQSPGLYSRKIGECQMSLFSFGEVEDCDLSKLLAERKLLVPGSRTAMGRNVQQWFDQQGYTPDILGEFDDVALLQAFARYQPDALFLAPNAYRVEVKQDLPMTFITTIEALQEEYYVIFAERMIQHPSVKCICQADYQGLFA